MSLTSTVPEVVVSLFHSSEPVVPSLPLKKRVPFTLVRLEADTFLTGTVPAAVPSLLHSPPVVPSLPLKKSVPFTFVRLEPLTPLLTITVPAAVPSLFHRFPSPLPSSAVKKSVPFTLVRLLGKELRGP